MWWIVPLFSNSPRFLRSAAKWIFVDKVNKIIEIEIFLFIFFFFLVVHIIKIAKIWVDFMSNLEQRGVSTCKQYVRLVSNIKSAAWDESASIHQQREAQDFLFNYKAMVPRDVKVTQVNRFFFFLANIAFPKCNTNIKKPSLRPPTCMVSYKKPYADHSRPCLVRLWAVVYWTLDRLHEFILGLSWIKLCLVSPRGTNWPNSIQTTEVTEYGDHG